MRLSQREMHKPRRITTMESTIQYPFVPHRCGEPIEVFNGRGDLQSGADVFPVDVRSEARFAPGPKVIAHVEGEDGPWGLGDHNVTLQITPDERYCAIAQRTQLGSLDEAARAFEAEYILQEQDVSRSDARLTRAAFGLLNFPAFWWKTGIFSGEERPIVSEFAEWKLTIEGASDSQDEEQSERQRSYLITHVAELRQTSAEAFSTRQWPDVCRFLYFLLGFMAGKRTGPALAIGWDTGGNAVWRDQTIPRIGNARHHSHWFPRPYPTHVGDLLANAWRMREDNDKYEALILAISWYWEVADREISIEPRLSLAQVGLELLAWVIMVEDESRLSPDGFEKLPAADKIALLANQLQASQSIPEHFEVLARASKENIWLTAPQALVQIRNKIIHPKRRSRETVTSLDWQAKHQVTEWAVWLMELGILYLLGYKGRYDSRVAPPNHGFPYVPWVDPAQTPAEGGASA